MYNKKTKLKDCSSHLFYCDYRCYHNTWNEIQYGFNSLVLSAEKRTFVVQTKTSLMGKKRNKNPPFAPRSLRMQQLSTGATNLVVVA